MKKILPFIIAVAVYLTPLYPIYAQNTASGPANLPRPGSPEARRQMLGNTEEESELPLEERVASRSALLAEGLLKFKDKLKANKVENLNIKLSETNIRVTGAMSRALSSISEVLERLKGLADRAEEDGKNVSNLRNAITDAENAWANADDALKTQLTSDYTIELTSEETVREDVVQARDDLREDLKSVHTLVQEARKALVNAISVAVNLFRGANNGQ